MYRDGDLAEEMAEEGHKGPVTCMVFSERSKTVWTGGGDCCLLGWSVAEKKRSGAPLVGHTDWVRCLLVCNGRLWSGSDDKVRRKKKEQERRKNKKEEEENYIVFRFCYDSFQDYSALVRGWRTSGFGCGSTSRRRALPGSSWRCGLEWSCGPPDLSL